LCTGRGLSVASIKNMPETMRVAFEEFSPTHDFFDYRLPEITIRQGQVCKAREKRSAPKSLGDVRNGTARNDKVA
jgi:hypothetical protein